MKRKSRFHDRTCINVLIEPRDKARMDRFVDATGRNLSPWVRSLILEALSREEAKQKEPATV